MNPLWKKMLPSLTDTWSGPFQGALIYEEQSLKYYLFGTSDKVGLACLTFAAKSGEVIDSDSNINNCSKNQDLYSQRKPPEHYTDDDFVFDEYRIAHQGEWGYVCTKNNELLWKKRLRGYLYTDIIKIGDRIVFGTAGMGGHFYSLDINSGEIIFDFNTKGTCIFVQANNSIYFAMSKTKTTIIYRIDYDGNILDSVELEGIRDDYYCPMALWDESIYIVTMLKKNDEKKDNFTPILHRIEL